MDASLSIGIHMLVMISESDTPMSSKQIAESVGVNASHVRRIAGLLKKAGVIASRQGSTGFTMCRDADDLPLHDVYAAVYGTDKVQIFPLHRNPNDRCLVGRYIQPVLENAFGRIGSDAADQLRQMTLGDVIRAIRSRAASEKTCGRQAMNPE